MGQNLSSCKSLFFDETREDKMLRAPAENASVLGSRGRTHSLQELCCSLHHNMVFLCLAAKSGSKAERGM